MFQFHIPSWLMTYDPNVAECEQLMDYVFHGLTRCGPRPTGNDEILMEVRMQHPLFQRCLLYRVSFIYICLLFVCLFVCLQVYRRHFVCLVEFGYPLHYPKALRSLISGTFVHTHTHRL